MDCSLHKALDERFLRRLGVLCPFNRVTVCTGVCVESKQLRGAEQKLAGAIALHLDADGELA